VKHVVQFSGGVGSWAAAKRVAEQHGTDDLVLLFADTMIEDEDLYRFVDEAVANIGGQLVRIADGRNPWEVFKDVRFIGNTRIDPCSQKLKRELLRKWLTDNCDPAETVCYLGIDWTEEHRMVKAAKRWRPWVVEAPLCDPPLRTKMQMLSALAAEGISPPRLYAMGFPHNNCGGFCVKAGQAQFKLLLKMFPERYAHHEAQEEALRQYLGKNVSILRDRKGKRSKPLTLRAFRERIESSQESLIDQFDWGGCGCAVG
jgi:hypothetical protein